MRVIGGFAKGRTLLSFKGLQIRPTSDKVRESIFNILAGVPITYRVLDLFAGTGAMGIEAISRGVKDVVFVESDIKAVRIIKKNLVKCGFSTKARILRMDCLEAIRYLAHKGSRFDLVFFDPPYDYPLTVDTLEYMSEKDLLATRATVVVEASRRIPLDVLSITMELSKTRIYGDTAIYFFNKDLGA